MSFDTQAKIVALLAADDDLVALLATYPGDATRPAIVASTMTDLAASTTPTYPCITFRESMTVLPADFRLSPAEANGPDPGAVTFERIDIEAWSAAADGGKTLDQVRKRIDAALNGKSFVTNGGAVVGQCARMTMMYLPLDATVKAWPLLMSYQLQVQYPPNA